MLPEKAENHTAANKPIRLELDVMPVVNYALQQNGVPVVQRLVVVNETGQDLEGLDLKISAGPELCLPYSRRIELVSANARCEIRDVSPSLNGAFLAGLTEKVKGLLRISLERGQETLYAEDVPVTALAFDEWHGCGFYPELLTAFVTPNHPEIGNIIAQATRFLAQWTGDPSLDGYQTGDPNRVLAQAGAVYAALQAQSIAYAVPPASFERIGQRVRLCDAVLGQKLGTCLDLTLLYAACLEAVGLHPLLIIKEGHIFAGVWLEEQTFPEPVQDDASLLTKRLARGVNEIAVVECTLFTEGKHADFDQARQAAEQELVGQDPVEYIIDVRRARLSGVTPLPQRVHTESGWRVQREKPRETDLSTAPAGLSETVTVEPQGEAVPMSRQTQWERKLLDLGLRNQLINMRLTKTTLPILTPSLDDLENALSDGADFSILPKPGDWTAPAEQMNFDNMHELGRFAEMIRSEFGSRRLRSVCTEAELAKITKELYRTSKTAMEENGANTLYLALGVLRWYESPRSTKARYAPIVLLPVDIIRRSAAQGYVIRLRDEEPQMNITMLEKLKQDFGIVVSGLDPLPQDEHGIDIRKVFTILRKAVMPQKRWDTLESAYLGIFSFSQFVMWNDIRNRCDDLVKNKIVKSLIDGKLAWEAADMEIGSRVPEGDVFLPMSADASQLFAIEAACQGESFVLHGPPGTGKSQTITALIANALAQNKTVLFVAEKMAALEVVQKRLESIGIGPFCLELHSNKSKKKDVLEQLRRATEVTKYTTPEEYAAKAEKIAGMRAELDAYAQALHERQTCGKTLYELIGEYESLRHAPDIGPLPQDLAARIDGAMLDRQNTVLERLAAAGRAVGHPADHPLGRVGCTQYSQSIRGSLGETVSGYRGALEQLRQAADSLTAAIGEASPGDYRTLERLAAIAEELLLWLELPRAWAAKADIRSHLRGVRQMAEHYQKAQALRDTLRQSWSDMFLQQDGAALWTEYNAIAAKWFLPKALGMSSFTKRMAGFAKVPVRKEELPAHLNTLVSYQQEQRAAGALFAQYGDGLDSTADWQKVITWADQAYRSAERLETELNADGIRLRCGGIRTMAAQLRAMKAAWEALEKIRKPFAELLRILPDTEDRDWIAAETALCDSITAHADGLKEWITWNAAAEEACEIGMEAVVDAYRSGMAHDRITPAWKKAVSKALASMIIDQSPVLNMFSGAVFNEKIAQFKRMDQEMTALTQQEIYFRLASRVPNFAREAAHSSEVAILQRAIRSGGRGISIRKLFEQIPNLLVRLCPCMLMSPISAAQYLDPKREPFHVVVFDEASQLPTCKAVGALARGKDAVIVGDPKQMPPTSFFATNTVDEENLEAEDLESILDDCLAMNMPQTHLLWHYRSRHESLIAFSNSRFYESKLYTFPSVNDRESKVRLVHVDGLFERGKARQNRAEAEAIVAELKRRCQDPELSRLSVGVVTFNISQQHLIDDLLSEACARDAALEKWAFQSEEPVFIKNLENVQGDERDVILFSIGYGPDENGKVYMNFGPLNREGGWRRLNVAVSRARCEMTVFSTLTPDQINLSKTSAEGVAALKAFLEYAGGKPLPQTEAAAKRSCQSQAGIADAICEALEEKGYRTDRAVGHSEYRIDIGVIDPRDPERYLLGILLDGPSYGESKTTRDRELAQIGVLSGLGWNILRVWSMDWWDNRGKELSRILSELERLPCKAAAEEPAEPVKQPAPLAANARPKRAKVPVYTPAALPPLALSPEEFLEERHQKQIRQRISTVITREAPVSEGLLTRRVVQSFGISRAGSRIQGHMSDVLRSMGLQTTRQADQTFFWRQDQQPEQFVSFRAGTEEENRRDIRDIPVQEIANAICFVLGEQVSMSREDLFRETAKLLGYTRMGGNVHASLEQGIQYARDRGVIVPGSGGAFVLSGEGTARAEAICAAMTK